MDGKHYDTLSAVPEGVATVNIGVFISGVINFIIMAFVVFMIVKMINKIREPKGKPAPAASTTKKCRTADPRSPSRQPAARTAHLCWM